MYKVPPYVVFAFYIINIFIAPVQNVQHVFHISTSSERVNQLP